jgi:hypothetical protein
MNLDIGTVIVYVRVCVPVRIRVRARIVCDCAILFSQDNFRDKGVGTDTGTDMNPGRDINTGANIEVDNFYGHITEN